MESNFKDGMNWNNRSEWHIDHIVPISRAKNQEAKKKMIETYNVIYGTNYSTGTNCGSCISTCFDAIKKLYKKYSE